MASDKLVGKAGGITHNGAALKITKWGASVDRKLVDATDSDDYDEATDMLCPSQLPVSAPVDVDVEGNFRKSQTPAAIIAGLFTGVEAAQTTLKFDAATIFGSGKFDITNFSCENPLDDLVKYKCKLKSNGKFTPGA